MCFLNSKKVIMKRFLILFGLLIISSYQVLWADVEDEMIEAARNEQRIYTVFGVAVQVVPPAGWKVQQDALPVALNLVPAGTDLLMTGISISVAPYTNTGTEDALQNLLSVFEQDAGEKILSKEFITFSGHQSLSLMTESDLEIILRKKIILFVKDDRAFAIQFFTDEKNFDALLPAAEECFKTFKIIETGKEQN